MKKDTECIKCKSSNIKLIYEGLETDMYKCLDCGEEYGITDPRRMAGFTKEEIKELDKKNERSRKNK